MWQECGSVVRDHWLGALAVLLPDTNQASDLIPLLELTFTCPPMTRVSGVCGAWRSYELHRSSPLLFCPDRSRAAAGYEVDDVMASKCTALQVLL